MNKQTRQDCPDDGDNGHSCVSPSKQALEMESMVRRLRGEGIGDSAVGGKVGKVRNLVSIFQLLGITTVMWSVCCLAGRWILINTDGHLVHDQATLRYQVNKC